VTTRRTLALPLVATAALAAAAVVVPGTAGAADDPTKGPLRPICFPVEGPVTYTDTWGAPRSGGRSHEGQDLMGKKMLKLLATADGEIVLFRHTAAGNYLYLKDTDGWIHAYIHVNNDRPGTDDGSNLLEHAYAPGIKLGSKVTAGQHIAYLGDSGNAEETGAHLHYELRKPNGTFSGQAVNAYNSLQNARDCNAPLPYAPFPTVLSFVQRQAADFAGRGPTSAERSAVQVSFRNGATAGDAAAWYAGRGAVTLHSEPVVRLFLAWLGRTPTTAEFETWRANYRAGWGQQRVARTFLTRYGGTRITPAEFATKLHLAATGTAITTKQRNEIVAFLAAGGARADVLTQYAEAASFKTSKAPVVKTLVSYHAMLRRVPTAASLQRWSAQPLPALTQAIYVSPEYQRMIP
jgi:hypothetical protein